MAFELEKELKSWLRHFRRHSGFEDGDFLEIESHIRDRIDHLIIEGNEEKDAFEKATSEFGRPGELHGQWRQKQAVTSGPASLLWMLPGWFQSFYRSMRKYRFYHSISVMSLAVSFGIAIVVLKLLIFESSYDNHFTDHKNIHRFEAQFLQGGQWITSANISWFTGEMVQEHIPRDSRSCASDSRTSNYSFTMMRKFLKTILLWGLPISFRYLTSIF